MVIAQLNDRWRIVEGASQWILMVRKGRSTNRSSGWRARSFCVSRTALLRCVGQISDRVDPNAIEVLQQLSDVHPRSIRPTRGKPS
jgi:hypothetical protein